MFTLVFLVRLVLCIHLVLLIAECLVEIVHIAPILQCVLLAKPFAIFLDHSLYCSQHAFILDRCWELVRLSLDDFAQDVTKDLA